MTLFEPVEPAAPPGPLVRVRMTVAYLGTSFHGFAPNPGVRTVGGVLGEALARVLRAPVELTCAGRTDAGVHAFGQVVSFDAPARGLDLVALARTLNKLCGPHIAVRELAEAPGFDARFSARSRVYRYELLCSSTPDPFLAATAWRVPPPLDLAALRLGCDPLIGQHDFAAFCRRPPGDASTVRTVLDAAWRDLGGGRYRFQIEAAAFCHQMVRSVVGTLVEVGSGRKRAGEVASILRSRDRRYAGQLAPPHGLCLWEVRY
ncbi:MAG: tRNA pseudouridine(38-40) synthase TruA [Acidimicrobiales bacterium]